MSTAAVLAVAMVGAPRGAPAQEVDATDRARRLARLFELPARRVEAVDELLALGAAAVDPLITAARHPDAAVSRAALRCLAALGPHAAPAVPVLTQLAGGGDAARAGAARWALGRIERKGGWLVAHMEGGQVVELGADGAVKRRHENLGNVWGVQSLPNGNLLLAVLDGSVREINPKGETVWEFDAVKGPYDAERLETGNTLIADFSGQRVVEVDPDGEVVWEKRDISPIEVDRLPNGHTLITDYNGKRVLEVDGTGDIVWKLDDIEHAYAAERLNDGSTAVVLPTRAVVRIYDRQGELVREIDGLAQVSDVHFLGAGAMVVAGESYVRKITATGATAWQLSLEGWVGSVCPR